MTIFEILLTILGVYILYRLIRFFIRFVLPIIIGVRAMKKAQEKFYAQGGFDIKDSYARPDAQEGEVTVETTSSAKKIIKDDIGD
ncbi:MAG: hypothetical protein PHD21_01455, partial [Flavobacteriales bacterium]|nr:hypothetical protein [Flavobacteriales bacterium]